MKEQKQFNVKAFSKSYWEVERADDIEKISGDNKIRFNKVCKVKWTNTTAILYTKLLSMYEQNKTQTYPLTISYLRLGSYINLSESSVERHIKALMDFGIITYTNKRLYNGTMSANTYTNVVDLVNSSLYKIIPNKHYINHQKSLEARKKRLQFITLEVPPTNKEWTREQLKYYLRNTNFEMRTGLYLKGDKTKDLLFPTEYEFSIFSEDITPHELQDMIEAINRT